jgi:enamine deaminase RidA (YjgF/YER057c/UK114 family)
MNEIVRFESNQRMSRVVKAAGLVFVGGQTSNDRTLDVKGQTQQVLAKIDAFLAQAGIEKTRLVSAQVWLADIARDFASMRANPCNGGVEAGCARFAGGNRGHRACLRA